MQWICVSPNAVSVPNVHWYMLTSDVDHFGKHGGDRARTVWVVHSCGMQTAAVSRTTQFSSYKQYEVRSPQHDFHTKINKRDLI
jgi:hypothetical protein